MKRLLCCAADADGAAAAAPPAPARRRASSKAGPLPPPPPPPPADEPALAPPPPPPPPVQAPDADGDTAARCVTVSCAGGGSGAATLELSLMGAHPYPERVGRSFTFRGAHFERAGGHARVRVLTGADAEAVFAWCARGATATPREGKAHRVVVVLSLTHAPLAQVRGVAVRACGGSDAAAAHRGRHGADRV
jgi:hypothetical protein